MRVHNLYCDADGQSHFRDVEIELSERRLNGLLSKPQPVSTLVFREVPPDVFLDWHNAPPSEDTPSSSRVCAVYGKRWRSP